MVLQLCVCRCGIGWSPQLFDFFLVERQLDLSSVTARLRGCSCVVGYWPDQPVVRSRVMASFPSDSCFATCREFVVYYSWSRFDSFEEIKSLSRLGHPSRSLKRLSPSLCAHFPNMESFLNPMYNNGENLDTAFYTSQDYQESLPHDLLEETTRPWVATVHASEGHHHDDGGSSHIHPPQLDDQAAQLLRLIPQLDQSQIQTLMTALKGKAASSPSPRAGASRPAAATSGPH
ncbi:hypothetical protein Taro_044805, partial [Colocasia esculenta]|nr:hypothetical protein [Colocasia esculenta]